MSLAFDRWRINDLKRELDAIGCHAPLEPHGQGYKDMSPAVDIVERLVIQRKLRHGAHPARCRFMDMPGSPPANQNLASQDAELRAAGCAKVFKEKVSGARSDRPERAKLLRRMEPSDVLVVTRLDRLARSTRDLLNILDAIAEVEASLVAG
jgi:Resolvase, N terminal domain